MTLHGACNVDGVVIHCILWLSWPESVLILQLHLLLLLLPPSLQLPAAAIPLQRINRGFIHITLCAHHAVLVSSCPPTTVQVLSYSGFLASVKIMEFWKRAKSFSRPGKIMEFEKKAKIMEKIMEFQNESWKNHGIC